jgi:hypothetical protein
MAFIGEHSAFKGNRRIDGGDQFIRCLFVASTALEIIAPAMARLPDVWRVG